MIPDIFDEQHLKLIRARAERAGAVHPLHEEVATQIIERLGAIKRPFEKALYIGVPQVKNILSAQAPAHQFHDNYTEAPFDLVIHALHLHSINDVVGALIEARKALKPDGLFLCCFFGGTTLQELRSAIYETEMEMRGGVSPRIFPMMDKAAGAQLLQRASFIMPVVDSENVTLLYPSLKVLAHDLRMMGESNALLARDKNYAGQAFWNEVEEKYRKRFNSENALLTASFEVIFLCGWTPA